MAVAKKTVSVAAKAAVNQIADIRARAMLARMVVHSWSAKARDKSAMEEVKRTFEGEESSGRYVKALIYSPLLDSLRENSRKARELHYAMTLPWRDKGLRILPSKLYFDYQEKMNVRRAEHESLAREFGNDYSGLVEEARKKLGKLFNIADYPSSITGRFRLDTVFYPIPSQEDWRADLGTEEVLKIKDALTEEVSAALADAMKDAWAQVQERLQHIYCRLSDENKKFHDTLVTNTVDLVKLLPGLNIAGDKRLDEVVARMEKSICGVEADTLRDDPAARQAVAKTAKDLLDKYFA